MDSNCVLSLFATLVLFLCITNVHGLTRIFPVTKYGAVADGKTDNSRAFLSAWNDACATKGGRLVVPPGSNNYLVKRVLFKGPCIGKTAFQNMGTVKASAGTSKDQDYWISFQEIDGLTISGRGTFDGYGASAWPCKAANCGLRPTSIKIIKVKNLRVIGITSLDSKQFHFHIVICENVLVDRVSIRAPGDSPNTDGIHVARCSNVKITNTLIATGDDCVSMGDGVRNINIQRVVCGPGHGISIGSLGKYGDEGDVTGVAVTNVTLVNTTNGLRIKTWAPSSVSTTVSNVTFRDIRVVNVQNPILIDQHYCPDGSCAHPRESDIKIQGVKYINVKGTSATVVALNLQCSRSKPCQNVEFNGVRITTKGGRPAAVCSSAQTLFHGGSAVNIPSNCGRAR